MKRVSFKVSTSTLITLFFSFWIFLKCIFKRFLQLPTKEPISLTSSLSRGEATGPNSQLHDKKKPFSRPFSKSRLEGNNNSTLMASPTPNESTNLLRQNHELRQRLQDESSNYRRRLETYKQAQSNQSALVSRLQAKVLQYKQRCSELETQMNDTTIPICPQKLSSTSQVCVGKVTHMPTTPSSAVPQLNLPLCPELKPPSNYCSDESDESFERKKSDEERKLWVDFRLKWRKLHLHWIEEIIEFFIVSWISAVTN